MSRFLKPDVARINLTNGDFIIVKRQLTAGEQRRVFAQSAKTVIAGRPVEIDLEKTGITRMAAYLVDWNLCDQDGKPVAIKDMPSEYVQDVLNSLDGDSFGEIMDAIDTHEASVAEEKKTRRNATEPVAT